MSPPRSAASAQTFRFRGQPRPAVRSSSIDPRLAPVGGRFARPVQTRLHDGDAALLVHRAAAAAAAA